MSASRFLAADAANTKATLRTRTSIRSERSACLSWAAGGDRVGRAVNLSTMAEYVSALPEIDIAAEQAQILSDRKFVAEANLFLGISWQLAEPDELEGQPQA
jgi:hypothetical protein